MTRYSDDIKAAAEAIKIDGGPAVLARMVVAAGTQPWNTNGVNTPQRQDIYAVFLDYKQSEIDGEKIKAGDQKVLVAALGLEWDPIPGNTVERVFDGSTEIWDIQYLKKLAPNGEKILFTLQVRR